MPTDILPFVFQGAFGLLVVIAALKDLSTFTIPNWISIALVAAFAPAAFVSHAPLIAIGQAALLGVGMLAVGIGMFALRWLGGGDAKLLAAASLWIGVPAILPFVIYTALAGGILAVTLLALRSNLVRPFAAGGPSWVGRLATPGAATPYGVAIAVGALLAYPQGLMMATGHS